MQIHNLSRVIIFSNNHILLAKAKRKDGSEFFFLPGGHIEYNESIHDASVRELKEEIGIEPARVKETRLVGVYEYSWDDKGSPYHEINFVSLCDVEGISSDTPVASAEGHLSFSWQPLSALSDITFLPVDFRTLVPHWLKSSVESDEFFSSRMSAG